MEDDKRHNPKGTEEFQELQKKYIEQTFGEIQCHSCIHYQEAGKCDAFDQIPLAIVAGEHDHRKPYPGDKGIRYQPMEVQGSD